MVAEIVVVLQEEVLADGLADVAHDLARFRPRVHAVAVVVAQVAVELELALAVGPGLDAQVLVGVAPPVGRLWVAGGVEVAAGQAPAVLGFAFAAGDAPVDGHGGRDGAAGPVEAVDGAEGVGVEFEVHEGGELGLRVGVEVVGGAGAGGLAEGVEVRGPPDRVPDLEVLVPVAVVDGAGVGGVPGLVEAGAFGVNGVGVDGSRLFDGVVEDLGGDAVEDTEGAGGRCCDFVVGDDGEVWASGRD